MSQNIVWQTFLLWQTENCLTFIKIIALETCLLHMVKQFCVWNGERAKFVWQANLICLANNNSSCSVVWGFIFGWIMWLIRFEKEQINVQRVCILHDNSWKNNNGFWNYSWIEILLSFLVIWLWVRSMLCSAWNKFWNVSISERYIPPLFISLLVSSLQARSPS